MKYKELTEKIIGCAMRIHSTLGNGFPEVIYQRCMEIEFNEIGLNFEREKDIPVYYKNYEVGTRRADFIVEGDIIVELKAMIQLEDAHLAQALNYLEAYEKEIGLLINFGSKSLQFKRLHNRKLKK
ncbi:MAG: GxxExxY protein [Candidatus Margulisiibacteriota bacterium]